MIQASMHLASMHLIAPVGGCVRVWQLASVEPALLLRHKTFYLRRACDAFDVKDLSKRASHLTNISLQKHHPKFGEDCVWDGHQFAAFLQQRSVGRGGVGLDKLFQDIDALMTVCVRAALPMLARHRGCFQLLGFDLLLNQQGEVSLLEVNRNPDLEPHTRTLHRILPPLVDDTLQVATEVNLRLRQHQQAQARSSLAGGSRSSPVKAKATGPSMWPIDSETGYTLLFADDPS